MDAKTAQINIPPPSVGQVKAYAEKWKSDKYEKYVFQEHILKELFTNTSRENVDLDRVLIKVSLLNDFYATNLKTSCGSFKMAKHIVSLDIDQRLRDKDLSLVNEIALVNGKKGKKLFSFATKYCSHHLPEVYPIYDGFVKSMLGHFKREDGFAQFNDEFKVGGRKDYLEFHRLIMSFVDYYQLNDCSLKEIDRYLWLSGKELKELKKLK